MMANLTILNQLEFEKNIGHSLFARFHLTFQPQLVPVKKKVSFVYKFQIKNFNTKIFRYPKETFSIEIIIFKIKNVHHSFFTTNNFHLPQLQLHQPRKEG